MQLQPVLAGLSAAPLKFPASRIEQLLPPILTLPRTKETRDAQAAVTPEPVPLLPDLGQSVWDTPSALRC